MTSSTETEMYMWTHRRTRHFALSATCAALLAGTANAQGPLSVASPDGRNKITAEVTDGKLYYSLQRDARALLMPSQLGFEFRGAPRLSDNLRITGSARKTVDETWTQPWGEVSRVRDHHNELRVSVAETIGQDSTAPRCCTRILRPASSTVFKRRSRCRRAIERPGWSSMKRILSTMRE